MASMKKIGYLGFLLAAVTGACLMGTYLAAFSNSEMMWGMLWSKGAPLELVVLVLLSACCAASGMEYYARYSHRDSWHNGKLWEVHSTHHTNKTERTVFELNDVLGMLQVRLATRTVNASHGLIGGCAAHLYLPQH